MFKSGIVNNCDMAVNWKGSMILKTGGILLMALLTMIVASLIGTFAVV